ncbi:MAG: hypothetical protein ACKO9B_15355 [Planctomycetota bacterium]
MSNLSMSWRCLAAAVALAVCLAAAPPAVAQPAPEQPAKPPADPPRRGLGGLLDRAGDRIRAEATKRFDRNGDGRLDDAERAAALDALKEKGADLEGQVRAFMLARFDADSSGTLDEGERKKALDEVMAQVERNGPLVKSTILGAAVRRFDIDGDGTLDGTERTALGDEIARRWLDQGAGDGTAARAVTREALRKTLLDRFDADRDGRLDDTERAAAAAEIESILGEAAKPAATVPAADPQPRRPGS